MLAEVIAVGDGRQQAVNRLAAALTAARVHGLPTHRQLLIGVLRHPEFLAGSTDTGFLPRHDPAKLARPDFNPLHAVAAALATQAGRRQSAGVQVALPSGWRNMPTALQRMSCSSGERRIDIGYRFTRHGIDVEVDGTGLEEVRLWHADPSSVDL